MNKTAPATQPEAERTVRFVTEVTLTPEEFDLLTLVHAFGGVRHFVQMPDKLFDAWTELSHAGLVRRTPEGRDGMSGGEITEDGELFLVAYGLPLQPELPF